MSIILSDSEFIYGANYATLGFSHFTLWTKVPLLQKYWPIDTLIWLCSHGDKLKCYDFTTFFNGLGAGNSIKHFHYQTLKESFPIFNIKDVVKEFPISGINRLNWRMPAYQMNIDKNDDRCELISHMDALILAWIGMSKLNTFNLAHCTIADEAIIIFIPRINVPNKCHPSEISNDFGGCEVCGRINIEDEKEWSKFTKGDTVKIDELLKELAPLSGHIDWLESHLS